MLKAAFALVLALSAVTPAAADPQPGTAPAPPGIAEVVATACLQALGDRLYGLEQLEADGKAVLCVRGGVGLSDSQIKAADFVKAAREHAGKLDGIFFTSQGGDAEPWLEFAERIGPVDFVIVGGYCASGCANYGFVLGRRKIVLPGSFVAWHGGPTDDPAAAKRFMKPAAPGEPIVNGALFGNQPGNPVGRLFYRSNTSARFLKIGRRTDILYRKLGLSPRILSDTTGARPPQSIIDELHRRYRPEEIETWVVLFPPEVLARCYGFSGLEEMWHPGGPEEVMKLGLQFPRPSAFIPMPGDVAPNGCPAEPAGG